MDSAIKCPPSRNSIHVDIVATRSASVGWRIEGSSLLTYRRLPRVAQRLARQVIAYPGLPALTASRYLGRAFQIVFNDAPPSS
jgi:hypothetical protein